MLLQWWKQWWKCPKKTHGCMKRVACLIFKTYVILWETPYINRTVATPQGTFTYNCTDILTRHVLQLMTSELWLQMSMGHNVYTLTRQSNRAGGQRAAGSRAQWCGSVDWRFPVSQETSSSSSTQDMTNFLCAYSVARIPRNKFNGTGHFLGIYDIIEQFHAGSLCSWVYEQWGQCRCHCTYTHWNITVVLEKMNRTNVWLMTS